MSLASLDQLLGTAARSGASDIILVSDSPVAFRIGGSLNLASGGALNNDDIRNMLLPLLEPAQYEELQRNKSVDFCFVREPRPLPREHPLPAGHARCEHPPAAGEDSDARIAASAGRAGAAGRAPPRPGAGHRAYRMRQEFHAGGA